MRILGRRREQVEALTPTPAEAGEQAAMYDITLLELTIRHGDGLRMVDDYLRQGLDDLVSRTEVRAMLLDIRSALDPQPPLPDDYPTVRPSVPVIPGRS